MKFRTEKVDEVFVIENCTAAGLEQRLSEVEGTIIDVQFATVKNAFGKTLHSALVLVRTFEQ
jgi:hypothetical protein